ncbi:phage Gp37/Gp68 family protein [Nocardia brasiliensis]|uniref:phage Gp37/Gp68 family protein n=1 Tax=Nocardia brasiliensis TaxID=37326 RepID=UPI0004A720D2|nr:phage Gp37/Gp68 family protein [Nocardia brasiliensis]
MTAIEWTEETWNPTTGCTRISEGCDHCYIERTPPMRMAHRRFDGPQIGASTGVLLHPDRLGKPLRWRSPRRVFVNSMSDLFHEDVPDGYIARVWEVMAQAPQHTFQTLTKRPARMRSWLKRWHDNTGDETVKGAPLPRGPEAVRAVYSSPRARLFADMLDSMGEPPEGAAYPLYDWMEGPRWFPRPLPNVWLGVSVESQRWADIRIPQLLDTPAAVRWISAEPLLGPVDIRRSHCPTHDFPGGMCTFSCPDRRRVDWVVAGGETGPGARPMHPDWARSLRDQCCQAGVPFFFKQWGDWAPVGVGMGIFRHPEKLVGPPLDDMGFRQIMRRVGKKAAGRELDGRTWDEYPGVVCP